MTGFVIPKISHTLFMRLFPFLQAVAFVDIILPEALDKFNIQIYNNDRKYYTF